MIRRFDLPTLRAAAWALLSLRRVRAALRRGELRGVLVPPPPPLPSSAIRGVQAVLGRRPNTCLERSLLLQRWYASQGTVRDVVIGVSAPGEDFGAHAWLDGDRDGAGSFQELSRITLHGSA